MNNSEKTIQEAAIEKRLRHRLLAFGARCEKWGRHGWPDRIVIWPGGRVDFIELKAPGKKPRPLQQKRAAQLRAMGCHTATLDSAAAVDKYIQEGKS